MVFVQQIALLFIFSVLGYIASWLVPLPPLIWAMLLLFGGLLWGVIKQESVELISRQLMGVSGLFFVPMIVGILEYWQDINNVIVPFLAVVTFGTLGSLAITAVVLEKLIHMQDARNARKAKNDWGRSE